MFILQLSKILFFAGKFLLSNNSHTICQHFFSLLWIIFHYFRLDNIEFRITFHRITDWLSVFQQMYFITFQRTVFIFDFICFSFNFPSVCLLRTTNFMFDEEEKKWRGINANNICRNDGGDFTVHVHVYSVWALSLFQYSLRNKKFNICESMRSCDSVVKAAQNK